MKLFMVVMMSLASLNASADYFKAGLGYSVGGEAEVEVGPITSTGDFDNTFMSPLVLAYGFEMMGDVFGEIEFAYRNNEYDDSTNNSKPTVLTGAFNFVGAAPLGAITLTGGAGFTFGSYDFDANGYDAGTALGVQLFGGLDFPLNETISIGGEFRYMTTVTKIDAGSVAGNDVEGSYNNASVLFNVKFGM
jgi:hypothetical protein